MKILNAILALVAILLSVYCLGTRNQDGNRLDEKIGVAQQQLEQEAFHMIDSKQKAMAAELASTIKQQEKIIGVFQENRRMMEDSSKHLTELKNDISKGEARLQKINNMEELVETFKNQMAEEQKGLTAKITEAERMVSDANVDLNRTGKRLETLNADSENLNKLMQNYKNILIPPNIGRILDSNKWKDPMRWRYLKKGFSKAQVVELLGQPAQGGGNFWNYGEGKNYGRLQFYDYGNGETLVEWSEPNWENLK